MNICPKCESTKHYVTVQLIANGKQAFVYAAKFIPQLKQICENGHYQKFAQQTTELIDRINEELREKRISLE